MSMNWLEGMHQQMGGLMDEPGPPMAVPVFAGQKLVVVGGSSGMGRQTAADVVAADDSAVIIGKHPDKVEDTVQALAKDGVAYGITTELADRAQVDRGTGQGLHRRDTAVPSATVVGRTASSSVRAAAGWRGCALGTSPGGTRDGAAPRGPALDAAPVPQLACDDIAR